MLNKKKNISKGVTRPLGLIWAQSIKQGKQLVARYF